MGALHAGHEALLAAARRECDLVVASVFVNPAQFGDAADLAPTRATSEPTRARAPPAESISSSPPPRRSSTRRASRPGSSRRGRRGARGRARPGHFRGVATVCVKLFCDRRPARRLLRPQGCPAGRGAQAGRARPQPRRRDPGGRDGARPRRLALSSRNRPSLRRASAARLRRSRAHWPRATRQRARALLIEAGLEPDYVERRRPRRPDPRARRARRRHPPDRQHPPGRRGDQQLTGLPAPE